MWRIEIIKTIGNSFRIILLTLTTSSCRDTDVLHQSSKHDELRPPEHQTVEDGLLRSIDGPLWIDRQPGDHVVTDGLGYVEDVGGHTMMRTHGVGVGLFGIGIAVGGFA